MENETHNTLDGQVTALLFWKGEPLSLSKLATLLNTPIEEITLAIKRIGEKLHGTGISLVENADEITLTTAPEHSSLIDSVAKDELSRDLGKAGLETLSIIMYRGPIKRSEIDYIRGVSSSTIVRNLLIRGLVEKAPDNENDLRGVYYQTTTKLLEYLGITKVSDLPEYNSTKEHMHTFEKQGEDQEPKEHVN
jgi:segregation and condensation protein B